MYYKYIFKILGTNFLINLAKKKFQQIQHVITYFNSTILCGQSLRKVNVSSADPCIQRLPRSGIRPMLFLGVLVVDPLVLLAARSANLGGSGAAPPGFFSNVAPNKSIFRL